MTGPATTAGTGGAARMSAAIAGAGFRRFSTYRQAAVAGAFTNTVFGFMRVYVLLAAVDVTGRAAGYDRAQLATFVWVGQGLLAVVNYWGTLDLADRIRTGEIVAELLRPVDPMVYYLATDLGRAGYAALTRFVVPVAVGMIAFDFYLPTAPLTYALFLLSVLLAVVVCFAYRYAVELSAFWLLDVRGVRSVSVALSGAASGLYFPLPMLPDWLEVLLWVATPFPALTQGPLDVLVERGGTGHGLVLIGGQVAWLVVMVALVRVVQRRAVRKLVVQGG